jgi:hypothetical protein
VRNTERYAERYKIKEVLKESIKKEIKDTPGFAEASPGRPVRPEILVDIFQQNNQSLPEVKALTSERLKKCRSRINQAERDGCLEQYIADFTEAVKKAQQTPFLRGEGAHGWRAGFDWFVANQLNIYAVLEGKYDGPAAGSKNGGGNDNASFNGGRTSRSEPSYTPRQ